MKIPYLDLSVKDDGLRSELLEAVDRVLAHGRFILGPEHDQFEEEVAHYCGVKYAVGVASGSSSLYFALRALDIGPGDEVITTPLTWVATINAIVLSGATPVFVDIGVDLNIDPLLVEKAVTPKTKAILPVHFTGQMCGIQSILAWAKKKNIHVIEDAAQSFGASFQGSRAGSLGILGCFSMNPMKVFNGYGEAGVITTNDEALRLKLESLRYAGTINKEDCHYPSTNGRLDTLQAAMLLVNFKYFEDWIKARRKIAKAYTKALDNIVTCPLEKKEFFHTYYSYTILAERRDELKKFLLEKGIETKIQHPILIPYHTAYLGKYDAKIPIAEDLVKKILCLPNHQDIKPEEVDYITACIKEFYAA